MADYLYRYDSLADLRKQGADNVLRARRIRTQTNNPFAHHQLEHALAAAPPGHGVFRISMWRTLADARCDLQLPVALGWSEAISTPVLQRVRADHPFLASMQRGDDEYLPGSAWLYWRTDPLDGDADWSATGIPHADIEVLDPDGTWHPFPCASFQENDIPPGWDEHELDLTDIGRRRFHFVARTLQAAQSNGGDDDWLLVRQRAGGEARPDFQLLNEDFHVPLVASLLQSRPHLRTTGRLVVAVESGSSVHAVELVLHRLAAPPRLASRLRAWLQGSLPSARQHIALADARVVEAALVERLYTAAGCASALAGDRRWEYSQSMLDALPA
ncbi:MULTISPECIES: hypothetical protein [Pseudomonadota]|uniref:Uncharacterized protein n=1 Tax=Rhodanobacter denitrificans TaxID=666685 RepID=M4NEB8_9GAMM|nr:MULTISPECIES: hypothetical protein [Pseudomonadota]AGG89089.1 hypothetical protein R2APBS1_1966 [Rhodanobacter denitrificans]TAN25154.1 MAG: hypothetical protein EPN31_15855 [Castellaniella sp.]UJJ53116.1 hypothetical protein LRK52_18595 [Rhodanobacter denitrificans]